MCKTRLRQEPREWSPNQGNYLDTRMEKSSGFHFLELHGGAVGTAFFYVFLVAGILGLVYFCLNRRRRPRSRRQRRESSPPAPPAPAPAPAPVPAPATAPVVPLMYGQQAAAAAPIQPAPVVYGPPVAQPFPAQGATMVLTPTASHPLQAGWQPVPSWSQDSASLTGLSFGQPRAASRLTPLVARRLVAQLRDEMATLPRSRREEPSLDPTDEARFQH